MPDSRCFLITVGREVVGEYDNLDAALAEDVGVGTRLCRLRDLAVLFVRERIGWVWVGEAEADTVRDLSVVG